MSAITERHLDGFLRVLAGSGVPVDIHRRIDFLRGVALTDLRSVAALYWAARVTLLSGSEQIPAFDRVFAVWFRAEGGVPDTLQELPPDEDGATERPPSEEQAALPPVDLGAGTGREASRDELLNRRRLPTATATEHDVWAAMVDVASRSIPRTGGRSLAPHRRTGIIDLRRVLTRSLRSGGEIAALRYRRRPRRPRRVLLLIDISGSLKAHSADFLRFGHALVQATKRVEVFAFGTRLTRITPALTQPHVDTALADLGDIVADFDGGTRIGDTFERLLANSRFLPFARGAVVLVLSDGLERGDPAAMAQATERLARLGHHVVWLSPLLGDPAYRPATRGMQAILGSLDRLGDASSPAALLAELHHLPDVARRPRGGAATVWRNAERRPE